MGRPAAIGWLTSMGVLAASCAAGAWAADVYPNKPIRILVPFAPGGGVDYVARMVGQRLTESFGQPVVVDNRSGGGGIIASETVARAAPDGYTLCLGNNSTHGVQQALTPNLPYDTVKDFTPIVLVANAPHFVLAPNSLPVTSVKDLIALAKAKPGQLNYGSAGTGSQTHLSSELFKFVTGTNITHIPYKGTGPGFTALLAGEIQVLFASSTGAFPLVQGGRVKALGITGTKRSQLMPALATLAEQGVNGFETGAWYVLLGPARLPRPIVDKLNRDVVAYLNNADVKQKFASQGAEPAGTTPEEAARTVRDELAKWTKLVKQMNLRVD